MSWYTDKQGKLKPMWGFVFSMVLAFLAFFVSRNIGYEAGDQRPFRTEFFFRLLWMLLLFGVFIWMLTVGDHIEEHRIAAQGLPRVRGWLKHFVLGLVIGGVLTALTVVPIHFWGHLLTRRLITVHLLPNIGAVMLMLFCGALAEELVFRGYPFQRLEQAIGATWAVLAMSLLYGALHLLNPYASRWGAANSVLIGVLLSMACLRTKALWLPWGIHVGWNLTLGFVIGMPVSGFRVFNLWLYSDAHGPLWLTGGEYGTEASASATVVLVLGILLISILPFRKLAQPPRKTSVQTAVGDPERAGVRG